MVGRLFVSILLSMPFIAYIPARVWIFSDQLWCLSFYPEWLDRFIYSMAKPYLSKDISDAASEMEFIEIWILSAIILEITSLFLLFLFRKKLSYDE